MADRERIGVRFREPAAPRRVVLTWASVLSPDRAHRHRGRKLGVRRCPVPERCDGTRVSTCLACWAGGSAGGKVTAERASRQRQVGCASAPADGRRMSSRTPSGTRAGTGPRAPLPTRLIRVRNALEPIPKPPLLTLGRSMSSDPRRGRAFQRLAVSNVIETGVVGRDRPG